VPSTYASASSTSMAVAASAGRATTSIPSSASFVAPSITARNMASRAGDGVWCTTRTRGTSAPDGDPGGARHGVARAVGSVDRGGAEALPPLRARALAHDDVRRAGGGGPLDPGGHPAEEGDGAVTEPRPHRRAVQRRPHD